MEMLACTSGARHNIFRRKNYLRKLQYKSLHPCLFFVIQRHGITNIRCLNTTVAQLLLVAPCNTNRVGFRKVVYSSKRDE
jgi:hypothetical protein